MFFDDLWIFGVVICLWIYGIESFCFGYGYKLIFEMDVGGYGYVSLFVFFLCVSILFN